MVPLWHGFILPRFLLRARDYNQNTCSLPPVRPLAGIRRRLCWPLSSTAQSQPSNQVSAPIRAKTRFQSLPIPTFAVGSHGSIVTLESWSDSHNLVRRVLGIHAGANIAGDAWNLPWKGSAVNGVR